MTQDFNEPVAVSTDEDRRTVITGKSIWLGQKKVAASDTDAHGLPVFETTAPVDAGIAPDDAPAQPESTLIIGAKDAGGVVFVRDSEGQNSTSIWAGAIHIGRSGRAGALWIRDETGQPNIRLEGSEGVVILGGLGRAGNVRIQNAQGVTTLTFDGAAGDVQLSGADCAEEFELVEGAQTVERGTVMIISENGRLEPSSVPYDTRVAGVISGAGDYRPGLVLGHHDRQGAIPIGLAGRVFCKVDAREEPVKVGDLLTTSDEPGHAMKAADRQRAFGAILGKALTPLSEGRGVIPVLIALT